jgi:hypothetical protein
MPLDGTVPFPLEILQLTAGLIEGISDRHLDVFVSAGRSWIAADGYVSSAGNGEMDPEGIGVTLVVTMLRAPNHDTSRSYSIAEPFELRGLPSDALFDEVDARDVFKVDL